MVMTRTNFHMSIKTAVTNIKKNICNTVGLFSLTGGKGFRTNPSRGPAIQHITPNPEKHEHNPYFILLQPATHEMPSVL